MTIRPEYLELGKLIDAYLTTEAGFNKGMKHITILWITDFIHTADTKSWPILDERFPEMLRALALMLDERNKINR